jgi:hypothetical protein
MTEPFIPDPSRLEVEIAIAKLKTFKSPGSDEIPAELIPVGGKILLIVFGLRKNCLFSGRSLLLYQFTKRVTKCNNYCGIILLSTSYKILSNILLSRCVGFDMRVQLLIRFSAFIRYWRKNGSTMRQYISYS